MLNKNLQFKIGNIWTEFRTWKSIGTYVSKIIRIFAKFYKIHNKLHMTFQFFFVSHD